MDSPRTDFLNQAIEEGELVVFTKAGAQLRRGVIVGFTPKQVRVRVPGRWEHDHATKGESANWAHDLVIPASNLIKVEVNLEAQTPARRDAWEALLMIQDRQVYK